MKKIIYTCDRCKQEITGNIFKILAEEADRESEDFAPNDPYPEMKYRDFCRDCADYFAGLINEKCKKGVPATVNKDFEDAVQDMVATSQQESPPCGQALHKKSRYRESAGTEKSGLAGKRHCSRCRLLRSNRLQRFEPCRVNTEHKESP